jgi:putative nucleotidyltransferase with HDIG domain
MAARRPAPLDSVKKVLTGGLALRLDVPYGGGMELSIWAEDHAEGLLRPLGRRWRHARAVAAVARELADGLTGEDADVLVAAAYLHDIGYAEELAVTGFHPLDGAWHLRALGHERLACLVAHHTRARHEARLRGLESDLGEFDDEDSLVSAALAYCDLTTGPNGGRMTPKQRLIDVKARYGSRSPVTRGLRAAWPELMEAVEQVEALKRLHTGAAVPQPR